MDTLMVIDQPQPVPSRPAGQLNMASTALQVLNQDATDDQKEPKPNEKKDDRVNNTKRESEKRGQEVGGLYDEMQPYKLDTKEGGG